MSSFINNLIDRSVSATKEIQPRLKGKFERSSTPSENFSVTEEFVSDTNRSSVEKSKNIALKKKAETVPRPHNTIDSEKKSLGIPPKKEQKPLQKTSTPDLPMESPLGFIGLHNLIPSKQYELSYTNINEQPKIIKHPINSDNENKQQQITTHQAVKEESPVIIKEVNTQLPVVKPIANNTSGIAPKLKSQQSSAISFQQKQLKPEASRTINISIGRIEVRVSQPPPTTKPKRETVAIMGLDEYLQKRNQQGQ